MDAPVGAGDCLGARRSTTLSKLTDCDVFDQNGQHDPFIGLRGQLVMCTARGFMVNG